MKETTVKRAFRILGETQNLFIQETKRKARVNCKTDNLITMGYLKAAKIINLTQ